MSEDEGTGSARPWLRVLAAFAVGVGLSVGVGLALLRGSADAPPPAPSPAIPAVAPSELAPALPVPAPAPAARPPIEPGKTLRLERAAFPASGPVRVSLGLPEMSADDEPRPVRLISQPDHRILQIRGSLESGRTAATIEVDPGYLQPGAYLVEMETTERSPLALRRYWIMVR
jgi:hypothetical protein